MFDQTPKLVRAPWHGRFRLDSGTGGTRRLLAVASAEFLLALVILGAPMAALAIPVKSAN